MGRRWKGPTIEWSYAWEETTSFQGHGDLSYYIKSGRISGMLVPGKNFSITKYNVWRHWWHSRSQISHEPPDILLTFTGVFRDLDGPTCSECLPVRTCDFEPPEHVPRASARAHTWALVFRRAPCVQRSREYEKKPAAWREKMPMCQKNTFIHSNICYSTSTSIHIER